MKKNFFQKFYLKIYYAFGLIPEFIGRFPVIASLEQLDEDALVEILTKPKNALVKQYQKLLELDDVELEFEEEALREIAKKAIERKTGARGLRSIIEGIMLDVCLIFLHVMILQNVSLQKERLQKINVQN